MTENLLLVLKTCVMILIFSIGLGSTRRDLLYLWTRPGLLLRSLLAMYLLVPLAAVLLARLLPVPAAVKAAIVVLAISAGAPLLPKKLLKLGCEGYVLGLAVGSSLVAVVAVPLWLEVIVPLFGHETTLDRDVVAGVVAKAFLLPVAAGLVARWLIGPRGEDLSEWLLKWVGLVFLGVALTLLVFSLPLLWKTGPVPLAALALMGAVALAIGHACGGPEADDRTALAVACASRHVALATIIAATLPGPGTVALVLAYALGTALVSVPYLRWRGRATRT